MKKASAMVLCFLMLLLNAMPFLAFAADKAKPPVKPYDKVVAKNGNWYTEQIPFESSSELAIGYTGGIDSSALSKKPPAMEFSVNEKMILKGITIPFGKRVGDTIQVRLKDESGNIYGPFTAKTEVGEIVASESGTGGKSDALKPLSVINYIFSPEYEVYLPTDKYSMTVTNSEFQVRDSGTGNMGAFIIKGVNYSANERYKKDLAIWDIKNNPKRITQDNETKNIGNSNFTKNGDKFEFEKQPEPTVKNPAVFSLSSEKLISELVVNTFNGGKGAAPGTISISDAQGNVVVSCQSSGGKLGEVANGVWGVAPNIVLPAGNYLISISDPNVMSHDKDGNAMVFLTAEPAPEVRYDFTGTYKINLDALKISTLMGAISNPTSAFSLKDFELAILDKDGRIELAGKYQDIPFSQECKIIEETADKVVSSMSFKADLTNLPYKAKITADVVVTLTKPKVGMAKISINGGAAYQRAASKAKGADFNTYIIKSEGVMTREELPLFVMTALGKSGGAGNIPGPDDPMQAATGLLFPPLVGLIVNVIQTAIKKQEEEEKKKPKKYTKAWYMQNNPGATEEQIAMMMLQAALENSDEPDDDPESIGDNEKSGNDDNPSYDDNNDDSQTDEDSEDSGDSNPEDETYKQPEIPEEKGLPESKSDIPEGETKPPEGDVKPPEGETKPPEGDAKPATDGINEPSKDAPEVKIPEPEPDTLTVQVDYTGRTVTYVKDPITNEWVNPDTGGIFDKDRYENVVKPNFEKDKQFIEEQREKIARGDTDFDREMRKLEQDQKVAAARLKADQKLYAKYGTSNADDIKQRIEADRVFDEKSNATCTTIGNVAGYFETGATVISVGADTAIDGLANVVPGGKVVKAIYKVAKGTAVGMAEADEKGKNIWTGAVSGFVKGGADAATGIDTGAKSAVAKAAFKAGVTLVGETVGGAISDGVKGAKKGFVDGVSKALVRTVTDKLGGEGYGKQVTHMNLSDGTVRVSLDTGKKIIGFNATSELAKSMMDKKIGKQLVQSTVKGAGGLLDKFFIKPNITDPIKKSIK